MKHYTTVTEELTILDKATCDKCGKDVGVEHGGYGDLNDGETNELVLTWRTDSIWDGIKEGPRHNIDVDLCFECRVWLFKLLESNGVKLAGKDGDL